MTVIPLFVPSSSDYHVYIIFANDTCWFHNHCCLLAVSVAKAIKWEKYPEQCEVLWKYVFALCHNYCNHWTHPRTADPVRGDAASASTH